MELREKAEEILETLWIRTQEEKQDFLPLSELGMSPGDRLLTQLLQSGYIAISDSQVRLTKAGESEAAGVVRRHRLAERLLVDVLDTGEAVIEDKACKFEHLLDRGLEESICTLLGHPKFCPHGKAIPRGKCCYEGKKWTQKVVSPLSELLPGQRGKIAYIYAAKSQQLQKLANMGILPGTTLALIQNSPSYVFQVQHTQFAVDKEIADAINVRVEEGEPAPSGAPVQHPRRRWRWRWGQFP